MQLNYNHWELQHAKVRNKYYIDVYIYIIVAPFTGTIGNILRGTLEKDQSRLLEYQFPDEGMTLTINVTIGKLQAHGSFTIKNPTIVTADFSVQSEDDQPDINFFISATLYEESTGQNREYANKKVYISISGLSDNNEFSLTTSAGGTTRPTPSSSKHHFLV